MPTKATGLKGYIAEEVVHRWLLRKYAAPTYQVIRQIIPDDCPLRGGAYLDFGVLHGEAVIEVYEVKGQDYIFGRNSEVNKPLLHVWQMAETPLGFVCQDRRRFKGVAGTKGFLVLLVPPNDGGIEKIGPRNIKFVKLFQEVWREMEAEEGEMPIVEEIVRDIAEDVREVVSILKGPRQGATKLRKFRELRERALSDESPNSNTDIGQAGSYTEGQ
jgi:hypothetical protein